MFNVKNIGITLIAACSFGLWSTSAYAQPGILVNTPKVIRGKWHGHGYILKVTAKSMWIYHNKKLIDHNSQLIHQNWSGHKYCVWGLGHNVTIWKYYNNKMSVKPLSNSHKFYRVYR